MKTIKNSIIAILAIFAVSCNSDDVENRPVVQASGNVVLSAPEEGNSYVLTQETQEATAERFVWSAASFGEGIIANYDLEIDVAGQNFDTPYVFATTVGTTQVAITGGILNDAVTALGATPDVPATFNVRVKAHVGDQVIYSNSVEISVTPFTGVVPPKQMYMVGDATEAGWSNNNGNTPLFRDAANKDLFYFTGYFKAGGLKFLNTKGAWQPQYGSSGDGVLGVNDGTGSDPEQISIATAGYYTVTVNTADNTYSVTPYDASAAPTYNIGILGDATPTAWDSDTNLTNSTDNPHVWHLASITLGVGGTKFRADDQWTNSWGANSFPSGKGANASDPNIPVTADTAGNYEVWFNDLDGRYLFIPIN